MAPGKNEHRSSHTGTIPKTKARNNCNVPQEAVTPTRRDLASNLVSTSLDWVPVSEYNTRGNYNQSRKPTNNSSSDHDLTELENSVSFESGFGRFVPVRPQPRALPLNAQSRENLTAAHSDDGVSSSVSGHTLHPYAHQIQNGLNPYVNHATAAVMIVNPTTPNASTGNITQPFNVSSENRNNLTRTLNPTRNHFDGSSHASNNNTTPPNSVTRSGTKTVNLINNMYDQVQGSINNFNENTQVQRESARALGEAIVAACPDTAAVERRLGQIREYIRVTSSLVDTMRNSEDEAYIEHTKEEYDELIEMVMKLKESESKLEKILLEKKPENVEVPSDDIVANGISEVLVQMVYAQPSVSEPKDESNLNKECNISNNNLVKVTNIKNDQTNVHIPEIDNDEHKITMAPNKSTVKIVDRVVSDQPYNLHNLNCNKPIEINDEDRGTSKENNITKNNNSLNEAMLKNIQSCVEKVAIIEELKSKEAKNFENQECPQEVVVRPVSAQSNGSAYSENELWQNEIKNKMEISQLRLSALKQQQKRLLKYQEEAKQQLEEINRDRQSQEIQASTSHDNLNGIQNPPFNTNYHHSNRMYAANQIGVATTLPQPSEPLRMQQNMAMCMSNNIDNDQRHSSHSNHTQDERFSHRDINVASSETAEGGHESEIEEDVGLLSEHGRILQLKLRELQLKKQHMENLVTEFQKLQMATAVRSSHNTYSSSGEDSGDEGTSRKCNKSGGNIKNEDPFKLMEIKAIKTALQKTKDLMRSVENYEVEHLSGAADDSFQMHIHSNVHDNKSEAGGSVGSWSNDGSICRVRNSLPQRQKFTNEQKSQQQQNHHHQQHQQQQQQHPQHYQQDHQYQLQQSQCPEADVASLQDLAQELRMETEKIMSERARIKDMVSTKEANRKQKKVNEEMRAESSRRKEVTNGPGPVERRQMQLRALLADKQRELEALLNKEKRLCTDSQPMKQEQCSPGSAVNHSYNSEQEEPDSRSEQILINSQDSRENDNFRSADSALVERSVNTLPRLGSTYGSDSDSASRTNKPSNQRNRVVRRQPQDIRQHEESNTIQPNISAPNIRHEPRVETTNFNMAPQTSQNGENSSNVLYHAPQSTWNGTKSNQDMRTNQFTQNSHSQTMERLLGTPQLSFPPSLPFNMMMPFGMVGGCGCGCACWGAWCWQQLVLQQRELHQLREQFNHLEERWRTENASHTLNNQVPPGNRANNYWDNFRSYSRQNLLSANSKTNADGHLSAGPAHNPHPLVERSHNTLHQTSSTPPINTPKRNTNTITSSQSNYDDLPNLPSRRNVAYERSLSFSSAPDVLNINQTAETDNAIATNSRNTEDSIASVSNVNINRQDTSNTFRNLNITNPIPEIIQSHSNNFNSSVNSKKKSSSKLPAKNSTNRRNSALGYTQMGNVNIASGSGTPNPNLASTSREVNDKATSKLFDLMRENVYSEVTALIGANESHPDFLIQLFRELQQISSDPLRQRVLQSIRSLYLGNNSQQNPREDIQIENESEVPGDNNSYLDCNSFTNQSSHRSTALIDNSIIHFLQRCEEICSPELLDALCCHILENANNYTHLNKKNLMEVLSKYEGLRVCEVSGDIIENLTLMISANNEIDDSPQLVSEQSESSILQDVAGSLNLFSSSDTQLHRINTCPYDWSNHMHMDMGAMDLNDNIPCSNQDVKVDLINCSEMHNGDLAEADQTCPSELANGNDEGQQNESLPDVVDTEEATPTEAEAEWLGLDRVPTRLHLVEPSAKQKD